MVKIIGFNGKTLKKLKIKFHCSFCGCDFEAEYGDYATQDIGNGTGSKNCISYCPFCKRQVVKREGF